MAEPGNWDAGGCARGRGEKDGSRSIGVEPMFSRSVVSLRGLGRAFFALTDILQMFKVFCTFHNYAWLSSVGVF